jgi:hypothetical protein
MTMEAEGPLCFVDGAKAAYTHALKKLAAEGAQKPARWALVWCAAYLHTRPLRERPCWSNGARCHKRALNQRSQAVLTADASLVHLRVLRSAVCRHLVQLVEAAGEDEETFKQAVQMTQLIEVRTAARPLTKL